MKNYPMFQVGDRVAYTAAFLRSCGMYDHDSASRRGTVLTAEARKQGPHVLSVMWDDQTEPWSVLSCNVILKDKLHLEPA
jgi:hypothetical protein